MKDLTIDDFDKLSDPVLRTPLTLIFNLKVGEYFIYVNGDPEYIYKVTRVDVKRDLILVHAHNTILNEDQIFSYVFGADHPEDKMCIRLRLKKEQG